MTVVLKAKEAQTQYQTLRQSYAQLGSMREELQPEMHELEDMLSFHHALPINLALKGKDLLHRYRESVQRYDELGGMIQDLQPNLQYLEDFLSIDVAQSTLPINSATQKALSGPGTLGKALKLAQDKASELRLSRVAADIKRWLKRNSEGATLFTAGAL